MKTMIHTAVPAAMAVLLAVLLSACAAPQPVQQQLEVMKASLEKLQPSVDVLQSKVEKLEGMAGRPQETPTVTFADLIGSGTRIDTSGCPKDVAAGITTQVTYNFGNMDPVRGSDSEADAREEFRRELDKFLNDAFGTGLIGGADSFTFVLTNPNRQAELNAKIESLATTAGTAGVPLPVRVDCKGVNLAFRELTRDYNSVSGVGKADVSITEFCQKTYNFAIEGIPKTAATAWVYHPSFGLVEGGSHTFTQEHICGTEPTPPPAFIMVLLKDPPVAQYRKLNVELKEETQIPLKSITVGKPACPPTGATGVSSDAAKAFRDAAKAFRGKLKDLKVVCQ